MSDAVSPVTASILVIGDEILSGRTKDKNIGYIAEYLTAIGIDPLPRRSAKRGGARRERHPPGRSRAPRPTPH